VQFFAASRQQVLEISRWKCDGFVHTTTPASFITLWYTGSQEAAKTSNMKAKHL
jgi:hypothetical protein